MGVSRRRQRRLWSPRQDATLGRGVGGRPASPRNREKALEGFHLAAPSYPRPRDRSEVTTARPQARARGVQKHASGIRLVLPFPGPSSYIGFPPETNKRPTATPARQTSKLAAAAEPAPATAQNKAQRLSACQERSVGRLSWVPNSLMSRRPQPAYKDWQQVLLRRLTLPTALAGGLRRRSPGLRARGLRLQRRALDRKR
jgi:hypothetical protein